MNTPGLTFAQRRAERRTEGEARLQHHRQRPLPTWLAGRSRRRSLAVAVPAVILAFGVLAALSTGALSALFTILLLALGLVGFLTLRRITQTLDASPATLLDERETAQRDRGYREAFYLAATLVFALWVLSVLDATVAKLGDGGLFAGDGWAYLTLATYFTITSLPAAALTWRWQPPTDDRDD